MPRPKAPCGTYSAYKRHLRDDEPVDAACRQASIERSREQTAARAEGEPTPMPVRESPPQSEAKSRQASLEWNLRLIETAMVEVDAAKLAPLSKRHSELLAEIESLSGEVKEADPFDAFFGGDVASNVVGFPTAKAREVS